jgi:hypothetical protein
LVPQVQQVLPAAIPEGQEELHILVQLQPGVELGEVVHFLDPLLPVTRGERQTLPMALVLHPDPAAQTLFVDPQIHTRVVVGVGLTPRMEQVTLVKAVRC